MDPSTKQLHKEILRCPCDKGGQHNTSATLEQHKGKHLTMPFEWKTYPSVVLAYCSRLRPAIICFCAKQLFTDTSMILSRLPICDAKAQPLHPCRHSRSTPRCTLGLRPISVLKFWILQGLTQAESSILRVGTLTSIGNFPEILSQRIVVGIILVK